MSTIEAMDMFKEIGKKVEWRVIILSMLREREHIDITFFFKKKKKKKKWKSRKCFKMLMYYCWWLPLIKGYFILIRIFCFSRIIFISKTNQIVSFSFSLFQYMYFIHAIEYYEKYWAIHELFLSHIGVGLLIRI